MYVDMNVLKMTGDSGATSHMTYKNELMQTYLKAAPKSHFIETANGEECEVVGYGQIHGKVTTTTGVERDIVFKKVYHVPTLSETLLSLRTCTKKNGCTFVQSPERSYLELPDGDQLDFHDDGRGLEELHLRMEPMEGPS
jgi:hypothetical protein